ncbi:MAG: ABC transporter substrate-binding protein [Cognatishimia sp.]|uniref:extracellular solute-binding protein n=1 Tax=Cognatishimia sp. TaxID=2211648 RepID=UPI003B8E6971
MAKHAEEKKFLEFSRRHVLGLMGSSAAAIGFGLPGRAYADDQEIVKSHGYSYFGDLKYSADYKHFNYVNPDAPRGGQIVLSARGKFDTLNRFARKGDFAAHSGLTGESMFATGPFGTAIPSDSLTDSYGLLAHTIEYPKARDWVIFHMRPEARFYNGTPVTAHDALFSYNLFLEQGIPGLQALMKQRIIGVEVLDDHTIKYSFVDGISRRSLLELAGGLDIFSKDWYEETGERLDEPSLQPPMGSSPYSVADFEINSYVVYKRNPDYWGYHLPINVGRHNYDRVRVEYFADSAAEFEGFKAGDFNFRVEGSTKRWATGYDFPAVENGAVKREALPSERPPNGTGFIFNFQEEKFQDLRVREALQLAFNFEWTSASLQYGLTTQRHSYVENTEIEATGLPEGAEKAFLESLGDLVPEEIFTTEAVRAHASNEATLVDRRNKRKALRLFSDAGWEVNDQGKLENVDGEVFTLKIMMHSATSDTSRAIITNYVNNLNDYGVEASIDKVDSAQAQQQFIDKEYEMLLHANRPFETSGIGLLQRHGSETADESSHNLQALKSELVDAIIYASLDATSREEEVVSLKALDRVLRYLRIQVPVGYVADNWVAYYDMFGRPEKLPAMSVGYLDFWWINQDKYDALKASGAVR